MITDRHIKEEDGTTTLWRMDSKHPNGPVEVVNDWKPGDESTSLKIGKVTKKTPAAGKPLPRTKQKYLNPKTGKQVGYVRAKNLGLI